MEGGETEILAPLAVDFDDVAKVTLREVNGGSTKLLGTVEIKADRPAPQPAMFKTSGAHYELTYRVVS